MQCPQCKSLKSLLEHVAKEDLRLAYDIIRELGGLPLALNQAGAYLEETSESLSTYLTLYYERQTELLQRRGGLISDHAPVATTWFLAFQSIELIDPLAIELIHLYAFLAPDAIPEELLTETAHLLNPTLQSLATNQTRFNDAIKALLTYSLIQRDRATRTLSIHRLVQAVIKSEMNKTRQAHWAERIVRIISHLFPFDEVAPWTRSQRYFSHALLAVEYISQWSFTFAEARALPNRLGTYFRSRGQYNEAEPLHQRALAIDEKHLGPNHPDTASSLNNLAVLYSDQGKYEQAESLHQRALAIREQRLGPDHPKTAKSRKQYAQLREKMEAK